MNALVIYRSLLSERDKNEFGYPEWDAAQKMLWVFIKKALEAGEEGIADEIVDELYSLSDCGCTLEDEAVKADLEMLEKYGFGSRADKVRELCWKKAYFFTCKVREIEVIIQRSEEYGKEIKSKQN